MTTTEDIKVKNSRAITESMKLQEEWYKEAAEMTLEKLPEFLDKLQNFYEHDYGTICHAITASAVATCWAMNKGPQGGITGFQAGAIMWEFIRQWGHLKGPARMLSYEDMLYPQSETKFKTIDTDTMDFLKEKAAENLADPEKGSIEVREHWQTIVDGKVPFGYQIEE